MLVFVETKILNAHITIILLKFKHVILKLYANVQLPITILVYRQTLLLRFKGLKPLGVITPLDLIKLCSADLYIIHVAYIYISNMLCY